MTIETLSLMGNSLEHPLVDVRVDVRGLQLIAVSLSSCPIDLMHNDVILWSRRLKSFEILWLLLNVLKILFGLK